jgi:hypothetical protein
LSNQQCLGGGDPVQVLPKKLGGFLMEKKIDLLAALRTVGVREWVGKALNLIVIILVSLASMLGYGMARDDIQVMGEGDTNFTNVVASGYLDVAVAGLTFGVDNLNALGYAAGNARAVVCGTTDITGTKTVSSGADTYEFVVCALGEAPAITAGQAYVAWCDISSGDARLYAYTITATQAVETNVSVQYCVVSDTEP